MRNMSVIAILFISVL